MSPRDVKAYRALKVMKSCHSFDSVVAEELLGLVWERYSITNDYELYVPQPGQRPFDPFVNEFSCPQMHSRWVFGSHSTLSWRLAPMVAHLAHRRWRPIHGAIWWPSSGSAEEWGSWGLVQLHGVRIPSFLYVLYRFVVDCLFCDIEIVNLKALRGMPRMSIAHVVAHATASSTREEPTKAPKVRLPEGGDTRPKKKPKLGFWKMSKSTTAQEAIAREACGAKEGLEIDRSGTTDRGLGVLRGRSRLERPEQRGSSSKCFT
ncbi:hypothetical protein BHE74_00009962 [Ensete ventricosum]|nr:hypothetical protein BHE74_00009962 [Ensete ventricosum]